MPKKFILFLKIKIYLKKINLNLTKRRVNLSKLSKKFCKEWIFFIKPGQRRRFTFNDKCRKCQNDCKQSYKCILINCNFYKPKRKREEPNEKI